MKRVVCYRTPSINDLMVLVVAFDEVRLNLDDDKARALLNRLATEACNTLKPLSELRLKSLTVQKDAMGNVTIHMDQRNLSATFRPSEKKSA